jgi:glycerophosphoryl diester phosphodiesterase
MDRRVICYAHQGGAREAPSNTMFAFRRALTVGADALELDVHASADRRLIVSHDPTVDRTSNGTGEIASMTLAELRALDNSYWFVPGEGAVQGHPDADYERRGLAPADPAFGFATLDEVLDEFAGRVINIDIKRTEPEVEPYEELLAKTLLHAGRSDDVIVASFSDHSIEEFRRHAPEIGTAAGPTDTAELVRASRSGRRPPDSVLSHVALQVPAQYMDIPLVDEQFVSLAHDCGIAVHVWTIDEPEEMARLIDLGVDGLMSDKPTLLAGLLSELELAWQG